jgi:hypothetical protein
VATRRELRTRTYRGWRDARGAMLRMRAWLEQIALLLVLIPMAVQLAQDALVLPLFALATRVPRPVALAQVSPSRCSVRKRSIMLGLPALVGSQVGSALAASLPSTLARAGLSVWAVRPNTIYSDSSMPSATLPAPYPMFSNPLPQCASQPICLARRDSWRPTATQTRSHRVGAEHEDDARRLLVARTSWPARLERGGTEGTNVVRSPSAWPSQRSVQAHWPPRRQ